MFSLRPRFEVYNWRGENEFFFAGYSDCLAVGCASGKYAIWVDGNLVRGFQYDRVGKISILLILETIVPRSPVSTFEKIFAKAIFRIQILILCSFFPKFGKSGAQC